jgi:hypothetical protein
LLVEAVASLTDMVGVVESKRTHDYVEDKTSFAFRVGLANDPFGTAVEDDLVDSGDLVHVVVGRTGGDKGDCDEQEERVVDGGIIEDLDEVGADIGGNEIVDSGLAEDGDLSNVVAILTGVAVGGAASARGGRMHEVVELVALNVELLTVLAAQDVEDVFVLSHCCWMS